MEDGEGDGGWMEVSSQKDMLNLLGQSVITAVGWYQLWQQMVKVCLCFCIDISECKLCIEHIQWEKKSYVRQATFFSPQNPMKSQVLYFLSCMYGVWCSLLICAFWCHVSYHWKPSTSKNVINQSMSFIVRLKKAFVNNFCVWHFCGLDW